MVRKAWHRSGDDARVTSRRAADIALIALLLAIALLAFAQSYQRWLDPIIDTGRDLYIPEQIDHGTLLYRDIRYQYPPLAPYLLAAITAVIGHSLASYTAIGIAQSLIIAAALWWIGRRTAGPVAGCVAALLFIALDFCGASTWGANFLFPYSYGATFGMAFLLVALLLFLSERPAFALAFLLAASWCKVEYAMAAVFIIVVLALGRRIQMRQIAGFILALAVSAAGALAFFPNLRDNLFPAELTRGAAAQRFFAWVGGVTEWRENIGPALVALAGIIAIGWLLKIDSKVAIAVVLAISILIAGHGFLRAWGFLQFAALVQGFRDRSSPLLTLSAFSIASTLRIPLNVSPIWYGFVLIVPLYALIAYVVFAYLPKRGLYPARAALWWIPVIALVCALDLGQQRERYSVKTFPIHSSRGTFYDSNEDRARVLNEFIQLVHDDTLAVMPEGLTLDYLTHSRTPLTYHTFTPVETADPAVEHSIIGEVLAHPPNRVAIVPRDTREFGYRGFGIDYDRQLVGYLLEKYRVERRFLEPRYELLLLRYESITRRNKQHR